MGVRILAGKVVSFINMKGGVGKTTLCIGIGEFLARYKEKKILFIDLDPQFNATQSLMNEFNLAEKYLDEFCKDDRTVKKIFASPTRMSEKYEMPSMDDVVIKLDENMHIIAGTIDLIFEDNSKEGAKAKRVRKFLRDNNANEIYDYIFIDCPPTISLYTDAALIASDYYLVPNRIDRYSFLGIKMLKQVIDRITFDDELTLQPLGIVYTMVKDETHKSQILKSLFEEDPVVKEIGLFSNATSNVNDLLVGLQGNISSKYKKSREDISDVCDEFLERTSDDD